MAASSENSDRRMVPRWRQFRDALANNELSAASVAKAPLIDGAPFLQEKEAAWLANQSLSFALDLVSASAALGDSPVAKNAAEFILESNEEKSVAVETLARQVLGIPTIPSKSSTLTSKEEIIRALRQLKSKRITQMRNAFVWVDLARLYVLLDQTGPARQAMSVALSLAPSDRFVLRSATRLHLHRNAPDEALHLLRSNARTPLDPWLIAAEIAVSSVVSEHPKFAKLGQKVLTTLDAPCFHLSELAGALGSLEMFEGRLKHARRFFTTSLTTPTDNALAQAAWATKRVGLGEIDSVLLEAPHVSEAQAINAHNHGQWSDVIDYARNWIKDEPFSARPRQMASATASSLLDDFTLAERFAIDGLATNPGHPGLINNIAFSLASQGKAKEALEQIEKVNKSQMTRVDAICLVATAGLAYCRNGNMDEGVRHYETAIHAATIDKNKELRILASLYLARERVLARNPQALAKFANVCEQVKEYKNSYLMAIAEHLTKQLKDFIISEKGLFS